MNRFDTGKGFSGSIPKLYGTHLVPLVFEPCAADLVKRLASRSLTRILEIAAGIGGRRAPGAVRRSRQLGPTAGGGQSVSSRVFVGRGTQPGKCEAENSDPKSGDAGMRVRRRRRGRQWMWLVTVAMCLSGCEPRPGTLREQWERSNQTFHVRADVYEEGSLSHRLAIFDQRRCHLRLLSAPNGSSQWRQFGNAYFGPCDADLKSHVRFVGQRVGYVFFQWWYTVTVDHGKTWHSWDAAAHMPGKVFHSPTLIEDVSIATDGTGTMTLNPEGVAGKVRLTLYTKDFGQQWTAR